MNPTHDTNPPPRPAPGAEPPDPGKTPLPRARPDLLIGPQLYMGKTVYVVKDPVSLSYFRLQPAEYAVLSRLDGLASAEQIAQQLKPRFPEHPPTPAEVLRFVQMLRGSGLIQGPEADHGARLRQMAEQRRTRRRRATLLSFIYFKIPLFDPDRLLAAMHRAVGPLMNRTTLTLSLGFMLVSAVAAVVGFYRVGQLAMPVLSPVNLALLSGVFFVIKAIHEFGHGLAAKHRGLEVHEMGVMTMVLLPMFYVDTSDAWVLPEKRDRIWINLGGMFIEFLAASAAVWVWLLTEPGWANQVAFNTMLTASVTTLLFNANPLLRYDGYYVLMDYLEVPNLRSKASAHLGYLARWFLLRDATAKPVPEAQTRPVFMPLFSVASTAYRVIVVLGIIALLYHLLDAVQLEALGALLAALAVGTMIVLPMVKTLRGVWRLQVQTPRRVLATALVVLPLAGVVAGVLLWPVDQTVRRPAVVLAEHRQPLFAEVEGRVDEVLVRSGERVAAGEPILRLADARLSDQAQSLAVERELAQLGLNRARTEGKNDAVAAALIRLDQVERDLAYVREKIDKLTIRAPFDGRLTGNRRPEHLIGHRLSRGDSVGMLVGTGGAEVVTIIPLSEAALVRPGMEAEVRLWAEPTAALRGRVIEVGRQVVGRLPHDAVSSVYAGEIETQVEPGRDQATPVTASVAARIALDPLPAGAPGLIDGMTGRGEVLTGRTRLGAVQWRRLRELVSLDWWL